MKPKVSIIIPNYNHAPFLKQRLESVFNQTYQNFEVILLDDASTDQSLEILNEYKNHPKVAHYIVNKTNSGSPFKQWQKGIELAKGDYVWIAESDDYCELNFLDNLTNKINSKISIVYCRSNIINQNGVFIKKNDWVKELDKTKWTLDYVEKGSVELNKYLRFRNIMSNASAVIFNKEDADLNEIDKDIYFCGDWLLWCALAKKGKIAFVNEYLNYFRKHELTTRSAKEFDEEVKRFKEYFIIINDNSTFISRILNLRKYEWVVNEWREKTKQFGILKSLSAPMPIEIYLFFCYKLFKNKLKQYLTHK